MGNLTIVCLSSLSGNLYSSSILQTFTLCQPLNKNPLPWGETQALLLFSLFCFVFFFLFETYTMESSLKLLLKIYNLWLCHYGCAEWESHNAEQSWPFLLNMKWRKTISTLWTQWPLPPPPASHREVIFTVGFSNQFIYSFIFIQQILTEYLLCVRQCSTEATAQTWLYSYEIYSLGCDVAFWQ